MSMAIEARGLVKSYPAPGKPGKRKERIKALNGLNLAVSRGTVYALLGPNGAGKTTAVKILTTLARPDGGAAAVEGTDVLAHPARARQVSGVVAQRSGADPMATGREKGRARPAQGRAQGRCRPGRTAAAAARRRGAGRAQERARRP